MTLFLPCTLCYFGRSTKCELAKALNHETCYKQILARRDTVILDLDEKLEKLEMSVKPGDKR